MIMSSQVYSGELHPTTALHQPVVLTNSSAAYSPQLGARLNASHTQLNVIGIALSGTFYLVYNLVPGLTQLFIFFFKKKVGTAFTNPLFGKIVDSRGPRILLVSAFLFLISGYLGMKSFYDSGLPPETKSLPNLTFFALILCSFLVGSGGSSAYTASVNSTAKTFPDTVVRQVSLAVTLVEFFFFSFLARIDYGTRHLWLWIVAICLFRDFSFISCG